MAWALPELKASFVGNDPLIFISYILYSIVYFLFKLLLLGIRMYTYAVFHKKQPLYYLLYIC